MKFIDVGREVFLNIDRCDYVEIAHYRHEGQDQWHVCFIQYTCRDRGDDHRVLRTPHFNSEEAAREWLKGVLS